MFKRCGVAGAPGLFLVVYGALAPSSWAQVLVVEPDCGTAGSTVRVLGSGWAEPAPVCEYLFLFDGAEFAPRQPDGLFGPPDTTTTIPAGAMPGDHQVQVELRLDPQGTLLQCRRTNFRIVAAVTDPWDGGNHVTANPTIGGTSFPGALIAEFDPTSVCDVTPCTQIALIQTIQMTGRIAATGMFRNLTFAEQGFPNAADYDGDVTPAGWTVDAPWGCATPYYPYPVPGLPLTGVQGPTPSSASLGDSPKRSDAAYPAGINRIVLNFEINVFCAAGQNRGEHMGQIKWQWQRDKGAGAVTGTSTVQSFTRDQPSAEFQAAVARWDANVKHDPFNLPQTSPPATGGIACQ